MAFKASPEFKREFTPSELDDYYKVFQSFDTDNSGSVDVKELKKVMKALGEDPNPTDLKKLIKEVDTDNNGTVEFNEMLAVFLALKKGNKGTSGFAKVAKQQAERVIYGGASADTAHSFSEEEKVAFVDHINAVLKNDKDVKGIPISNKGMQLFSATKDGIILCKLVNDAVPDTIDERVINTKQLNAFKMHENQTLAINSAKAIGCNVTNVGAEDIIEGKPHIILGLIWQIVRIGLFSQINLVNHPELYRLLEPGETIEDLLKLPIEQILLRWVNYHLKNSGRPKRVKNFGGDIKDSEAYTILLHQIAPKTCSMSPLKTSDLRDRAEQMLQNADKLDCRKFISPGDVVKGNQKLNLAFVANLFNTHPALEPVEVPKEDIIIETREEKSYRNWMNSLGVSPYIKNLYIDLRDGTVLLQLFDKIKKGILDPKKVNWEPNSTWTKVENCNYAVVLGKSQKFSLVGIQGKDIMDGNKTLTLALVWQMMRFHLVTIIKQLSKDGADVTDDTILKWSQNKLKEAGKKSRIPNFKSQELRSGVALIDLVDAVSPGSVNYSMVKDGAKKKDAKDNAKLAVSLARKIGATVFALPEDIWEVKGKMILAFCATLMAVDLRG